MNPAEITKFNHDSGNDDSNAPHLVTEIKQELDNEDSGNDDSNAPHLGTEIKQDLDNEISEEIFNNGEVNIEHCQLESFNENVTGCHEVNHPSLCTGNRYIKDEISDDTLEHLTNSQDDVQKIQIESVYSVQHSQLVRSDVFSENLPEHVRKNVKNTSNEMDKFEKVHEHKGSTVVKLENKNGDQRMISREQILNALRVSLTAKKHQVKVGDVIGTISKNKDKMTVNNGECSKLLENQFCVSKKVSRDSVCSVSCENLDKSDVSGVDLAKIVSLDTHRKKYGVEKSDKRHVSNLGFTSDNFRTHKNSRTGEKSYSYDISNLCFVESRTLKRHIDEHALDKPYKCDVCGLGFTRSGHLQIHRRTHTGEKPYKCDICDMGFTQNSQLQTHSRTHTGERPYKCDVCNVRFTRTDSLKLHRRTHTGEKPYKCDICDVRFTQPRSLRIHRRTHTGEKPYKCDLCDVRFAQPRGLKIHKRTHTREKPYKCDVCDVRFAQMCGLKIHKRIHTGEKPYKCDVCSVEFTYGHMLKKHKRIHT